MLSMNEFIFQYQCSWPGREDCTFRCGSGTPSGTISGAFPSKSTQNTFVPLTSSLTGLAAENTAGEKKQLAPRASDSSTPRSTPRFCFGHEYMRLRHWPFNLVG